MISGPILSPTPPGGPCLGIWRSSAQEVIVSLGGSGPAAPSRGAATRKIIAKAIMAEDVCNVASSYHSIIKRPKGLTAIAKNVSG